MEKISVIVPVFNSEKYLSTCVESIQKQTFSNLEIILVDDGSVDNSGNICDEFAKEDRRIRVIHKANAGVSAARNEGLKIVTGDWISFIDSDDELEIDMYEFLIRLAEENNAQIAHCGYKRVSEDGSILKEVSGTHQVIVQNSAEAIECMLEGRYFVGGLWNKLFKRACIKSLQFSTQLKNNEDILFNALAFKNAKSIVFADETKYKYFEHNNSACNLLSRERKIKDSMIASQILVQQSSSRDVQYVAEKWHFLKALELYRFYIFSDKSRDKEILELNIWLKENHSLAPKSLKGKLNYLLLVHFKGVYKIVYSIYDSLRKPNWDVR